MMNRRSIIGEFIGTFILVFIGCGSVGYSILVSPLDLWQIAAIWGLGVALAIFASSPLSRAHLNPAVTVGFVLNGQLTKRLILPYMLGQFSGAFTAASVLYLLFKHLILVQNVETAMMFGEYYPNPGNPDLEELNMFSASCIEGGGTFLLMFGIFAIIHLKLKKGAILNPLLIGILLSILIYLFAPFTQAGFNPARDFSPRLFSYFLGWNEAFSFNDIGWLVVYIISPVIGATLASILARKIWA